MVVEAAADYLKAYAIDCLFTAIFFCYVGFYNGIGMTKFVMIQGIIGAFCVRIPVSWFMSRKVGATLFNIGLATPFSSILQLVLCLGYMLYLKKEKQKQITPLQNRLQKWLSELSIGYDNPLYFSRIFQRTKSIPALNNQTPASCYYPILLLDDHAA